MNVTLLLLAAGCAAPRYATPAAAAVGPWLPADAQPAPPAVEPAPPAIVAPAREAPAPEQLAAAQALPGPSELRWALGADLRQQLCGYLRDRGDTLLPAQDDPTSARMSYRVAVLAVARVEDTASDRGGWRVVNTGPMAALAQEVASGVVALESCQPPLTRGGYPVAIEGADPARLRPVFAELGALRQVDPTALAPAPYTLAILLAEDGFGQLDAWLVSAPLEPGGGGEVRWRGGSAPLVELGAFELPALPASAWLAPAEDGRVRHTVRRCAQDAAGARSAARADALLLAHSEVLDLEVSFQETVSDGRLSGALVREGWGVVPAGAVSLGPARESRAEDGVSWCATVEVSWPRAGGAG